jgi:hypothetical protein
MNRRQKWMTLAALGLALAAGTARAQTGASSSSSSTGSAPAVTWEFTTTRGGGEARLQVQTGQGATATCESMTFKTAGGTPITLTADGQKVRVQSGPGGHALRIYASADRVTRGGACGEMITLQGHARAQFELKGQGGQITGERVTLNLGTGSIEVAGSGPTVPQGPTAMSLDFGFPVAKPAAEKEQSQVFNFWQSFSR